MAGSLIIMSIGDRMYCYNHHDIKGLKEAESDEALLKYLEDKEHPFGHTVFYETYRLFEANNHNSKINRAFCKKVINSVENGARILIIVPNEKYVDITIRNKATIIKLPNEHTELKIEDK